MREILFKAKRTDNGEWAEGFYCKRKTGYYDNIGFHEEYKGCIVVLFSDGGITWVDVEPETLCQYTGLIDKNGNKIWENDIVREFAECDELGKNLYFCYQIIWDKEYCAFVGCDIRTKEIVKFSDLGEVEVIINVFDNPKLLKDGDEA